MELTSEQIIEAITTKPELVGQILPTLETTDVVKSLITNKADSIYKTKIGEEVSAIYKRLDDDAFEILGERPGNNEDGTKMKTYNFLKNNLYKELKELREQKDSLSKDAKVQELEGKIKELTENGGGKHVQSIFDQAKQNWESEKKQYLKQIQDAASNNETFQKKTAIANALQQIKFNPDVTESIKKMVLNTAENELIKNSKFENNELVFLNADGTPSLNAEYKPKNALEALTAMEAIKDISLKSDPKKGGGADPKIVGSIKTVTVEGKDVKSIVLPEGSFKTKTEFNAAITKALLDSGITRRMDDWDKLSVKAYKEYNVSSLPIN